MAKYVIQSEQGAAPRGAYSQGRRAGDFIAAEQVIPAGWFLPGHSPGFRKCRSKAQSLRRQTDG